VLRGENHGTIGPVLHVLDDHHTGGSTSSRVQGSKGALLREFHHVGAPGLRTSGIQGGLQLAWRETQGHPVQCSNDDGLRP
jgi:hypothetical protein